MEGFEVFCWDEVGQVEQYFKNIDKRYEEFIPICSRIRKEIREDQITGGMVGQYNPSITQRLNNLKEQVEQINIEQPLFKLDADDNQ
jgi:DNA polymerase II small subunit/DNA polymerase delta subunit B